MIKLNFTFALKNNPTWIHSKQPPHQKKEEDKFRNWVSNMFWPASTPSKQWIQRLLSPLWPPTSTSSSFNSVPPSFNCVAITKSQQWHLSVKMVYFAFYFLGQKYSLFGRYYGWWEWEWMTPLIILLLSCGKRWPGVLVPQNDFGITWLVFKRSGILEDPPPQMEKFPQCPVF